MADSNADSNHDGRTPDAGAQQNLSVLAQYVKDLSFENPGAPLTLTARAASPSINIGINVRTDRLPGPENDIEVALAIDARAVDGETTLFVAELVYAGVFRLVNIAPENVLPITMIECPRLLFPFARQILADATRNGGFPPLLLEPVDFVSLFRQRMAQAQPQPPQNLQA
jgi:preprotein translocase subunit SecB